MTHQASIAHYRLTSKLGEGGMGAVYRATDTKLGRDVAIKVLPPALANDADYLARFQREAQVLASLNHPNIAAIYGLEENAIVMELVEGETLMDRISRGPVPLPETRAIARQICDALEAAHGSGIVHRDLKPANIKLDPGGRVKVLDFGLAKAVEPQRAATAATVDSPTLSIATTRAGLILGTAGYMSPEQARGAPVDKRSDIWSFGVVLLELLTGRATFEGGTVADTLAAVLRADVPLAEVPSDTPSAIRRLLERCLQRDPSRRLHDIADARLELDAEDAPVATMPNSRRRAWLPWALAALVSGAALAFGFLKAPKSDAVAAPATFTLHPPDGFRFGNTGHALSQSGRIIAAVMQPLNGAANQLWVRSLDTAAWRYLPGADGATQPACSPDGRSIAFLSGRRFQRMDLETGVVRTLGPADESVRGLAWTETDGILFGSNAGPVQKLSEQGGSPIPLTRLNKTANETGHGFPAPIPGTRDFVYSAFSGMLSTTVSVADLDGRGPQRALFPIRGGAVAFAMNPESGQGLLVYRQAPAAMAVAYDPKRRTVLSEAFQAFDDVAMGSLGSLPVRASLPAHVILVNQTRSNAEVPEFVLLNRKGERIATLAPASEASWSHPEFSPDGKTLLGDRSASSGGGRDVWSYDLTRRVASRVTVDPGDQSAAVFSADGRRVFYSGSVPGGRTGVWEAPADGSGKPRLLREGAFHHLGVSPDGRSLAMEVGSAEGVNDTVLLSLDDPGKTQTLLSGFATRWPQFSPDGKWIAVSSNESGGPEIYVQSVPAGRGKWRISQRGGAIARWRGDGREIVYYERAGRYLSVSVRENNGTLEFGAPVPLFELKSTGSDGPTRYFAMSPDGQRFAMTVPQEGTEPRARLDTLTVYMNWMNALKRR